MQLASLYVCSCSTESIGSSIESVLCLPAQPNGFGARRDPDGGLRVDAGCDRSLPEINRLAAAPSASEPIGFNQLDTGDLQVLVYWQFAMFVDTEQRI